MKKLPIGIQSFGKLREENCYYVDKTFFVKKLAEEGGCYFLSRPRRFGKSLFLDTLRQAFLGKKELFEGLYLEKNWDWGVKYPVVHISFGAGVHRKPEELIETQRVILEDHAQSYQITLTHKFVKDNFFQLIKKLSQKFNQKVVVLIDEYDKPILDNITNPEVATEMREILKNFYSVLKDADEFLKFVFITGVSKFSKVSIFSGLNNLKDITLDPAYATICGYTQEELETVFAERIKGLDLEGVRLWYNGYSFLGESVYNPFDILLYLDMKEFRPYWFETGTPTFLIRLLHEQKYFIPQLEHLEASEKILSSFELEDLEPETLLFQTGYLTIKKCEKLGFTTLYTLSYPNLEVKISFSDYLLDYFSRARREKERNYIRVYRCFQNNDLSGLKEVFQNFFASIPYDWYRKNELSGYEGFYASIFYCYFTALGLDVRVEEGTNYGRLDMSVIFGERVYLFEFKVVEIEGTGKAIEQIKKKRYYERYSGRYKDIYLIGIEFSRKERNIVGFCAERVQVE